ncbi:MAG: hypothetical protein JXA97_03240 [Anaerolineales bacterium]|nr:hypothetical protein [Anaerolineales bacterium]
MRSLVLHEPVEVQPDTIGFPLEFLWRRQRYRVGRVERWHKRCTVGGSRSREVRRFQLTTVAGLRCILEQDANHGTWALTKVLNGKVS